MTLPTVIVMTAMMAMTITQVSCSWALTGLAVVLKLSAKTRRKAAKTAAFGAVLIKPVTSVGAPSYTSGVHRWKGALAILNPNPTSIIAAPIINNAGN